MRALAIDDEPLALAVIETFVKKTPAIKYFEKISSSVEALKYLENNEVDIIFLDINMPEITGIELAAQIPDSTMIIFTTAYEKYALKGFDLNAIDYLLKPISFDRFSKAITKAESHYSKNIPVASEKRDDFLMIRVDYATVKVSIEDVYYVEGLKDYIKIVTKDKNYVTKSTMKNIELKITDLGFMRVHKSFIINLNKFSIIENNHISIGDKKIPIGSGYRDELNSYVEKFKL